MTTALPARVNLSRNEDLRLAFELVDEAGAEFAIPAGTWSFVLKSRADEITVTLTERSGVDNIFDAVVLLASLETTMPVGRLFTGDLKRVSSGATSVWASVAVVRENVVQETDDLGGRIIQVTRTDGETISVVLSSGSAATAAAASAAAADASATAAGASEASASGSAISATASASSATNSANAASGSATSASNSAIAAALSEVDAESAATEAEGYRDEVLAAFSATNLRWGTSLITWG